MIFAVDATAVATGPAETDPGLRLREDDSHTGFA
jgi:hypothetical protein